jgi:hypothetical protein
LLYVINYSYNNNYRQLNNNTNYHLIIESECSCKQNERIQIIKEQEKNTYQVYINNQFKYSINNNNENLNLTCNLYNSLRRGKNQKVIAYSLYGQNQLYFRYLKNITKMIKHLYPDWIIRIYHDNTILANIKCELECLQDDIIDFCNIEKLPMSLIDSNLSWSTIYIHKMIWRFLPIGDSFVSIFNSRDTDSLILKRELDSVNYWLESTNKTVHIMRDNPHHGTAILGGMWGYRKNELNLNLARKIFELMLNKQLALKYNFESRKGLDQFFLADHVYPLIKQDAVIHDSYLCLNYRDSQPFPTKRIGNCFVGAVGGCNETGILFICPIGKIYFVEKFKRIFINFYL